MPELASLIVSIVTCARAFLALWLTPYVGRRTGERVLFEVQMHDGGHEAQLDRKHGDPIAAEVQEGQLKVRDLWKGDKNKQFVKTSSSLSRSLSSL